MKKKAQESFDTMMDLSINGNTRNKAMIEMVVLLAQKVFKTRIPRQRMIAPRHKMGIIRKSPPRAT